MPSRHQPGTPACTDIATSQDELVACLQAARKNFRLEKIALDETEHWSLNNGALQHATGGFFSIVGASFGDDREGLYLYQPQSALTGLLTAVIDGETRILLQARAEPGTSEAAQFGPTIQSTEANYLGLHGGKPAPYVRHFRNFHPDIRRVIHDSEQLDLGERYLFKSKRLAILEARQPSRAASGFVWVPASLIADCVHRSYFLNTDLRSLLAVLPWKMTGASEIHIAPKSATVRLSLDSPLRPEIIGRVFQACEKTIPTHQLKPLQSLENWSLTGTGFYEKKPVQHFAVEFYRTSAVGREVKSWCQPLISSNARGQATLLLRKAGKTLEVAVRIGAETGLKPGVALLPTFLSYPGAAVRADDGTGSVLCATMESDEGGRFLHAESRYELRLADHAHALPADCLWLNLAEIKWLVARSFFCSIQLRGLLSMLLGDLEPLDQMP